MNKAVFTAVCASVLIVGCYSFNRYETKYVINNQDTPATTKSISLIPTAQAKSIVNERRCVPFQLPQLPDTPPLPYEELSKLNIDDPAAVDQLQQKHIEDLRLHIVKIKQAIAKAQKEHLSSCSLIPSGG